MQEGGGGQLGSCFCCMIRGAYCCGQSMYCMRYILLVVPVHRQVGVHEVPAIPVVRVTCMLSGTTAVLVSS